MTKFRSRPQEVEAIFWSGDNFNAVQKALYGKVRLDGSDLQLYAGKDGGQGWVPVPVGHWLVHKPDDTSDVWPVENTYFRDKYEALCPHGKPSADWNYCCDYESW